MSSEVLIVGGGFAGLCLTRSLIQLGMRPSELTIIDEPTDLHRASKAPRALLNPIPGRSMNPKRGTPEAFQSATTLLTSLTKEIPDSVHPVSLLRPFRRASRNGERLERSFVQHRNSVTEVVEAHLWNADETERRFPYLARVDGLIELVGAWSVDLAAVCSHLKDELSTAGVTFIDETSIHLERQSHRWVCRTPSQLLEAQQIVLASGSRLGELFPKLGMSPTGGHLAIIRWKCPQMENTAVSMGGHLAPMTDDHWVLGTTHVTPSELNDRSNTQIFEGMQSAMAQWIPSLKNATLEDMWSGVRSVLPPKREPVTGRVPGFENLYVLGGFASKGLLWIPFAARELARLVTNRTATPASPLAEALRHREHWVPHPDRIH